MVVTFGVVESEVVSWLTTTGSSPQVVLARYLHYHRRKLATVVRAGARGRVAGRRARRTLKFETVSV